MTDIKTLEHYLNALLDSPNIKDYCPNGLQIEGKNKITRVATAVTASASVIKAAIEYKADCLLVHHGYFWKNEPAVIVGMKRNRIALLLQHNINLLSYHLPLDIHASLGNNSLLGRFLEFEQISAENLTGIPGLVYSGSLSQKLSPSQFGKFLEQKLQHPALHLKGRKRYIEKIAWCTGAAEDLFPAAIDLGIDAFITGEVSERSYHQANESGVHYFACGHHATERLGICALGEHLLDRFGTKHQFIDEPNPI